MSGLVLIICIKRLSLTHRHVTFNNIRPQYLKKDQIMKYIIKSKNCSRFCIWTSTPNPRCNIIFFTQIINVHVYKTLMFKVILLHNIFYHLGYFFFLSFKLDLKMPNFISCHIISCFWFHIKQSKIFN